MQTMMNNTAPVIPAATQDALDLLLKDRLNLATTVSGSALYGTATSQSDDDFRCVFLPTKVEILTGHVFFGDDNNKANKRLGQGDIDIAGERRQPLEFVGVFLRAHALSIRHVEIQHPDVPDGRAQDPALGVRVAVEVRADVYCGFSADQRDAVIGRLPAEGTPIAQVLEFADGEFVIGNLSFLQPEHVGRGGGEPVPDMLQADAQAVHVPGRNFHTTSVPSDEIPA